MHPSPGSIKGGKKEGRTGLEHLVRVEGRGHKFQRNISNIIIKKEVSL